jgi:hypothetical protein
MEDWSGIDALYFSLGECANVDPLIPSTALCSIIASTCINTNTGTLLTIGYGDVAPETSVAKVFTVIFITAGTILTAVAIGLINAYEIRLMGKPATEGQRRHQRCLESGQFSKITWGILIAMVVIGVTYVHVAESFSIVDSLYFITATLGHVGYGDLFLIEEQSHLFLIFFVSFSWFITLYLLGRMTNVFVSGQVRAITLDGQQLRVSNKELRKENENLQVKLKKLSRMLDMKEDTDKLP